MAEFESFTTLTDKVYPGMIVEKRVDKSMKSYYINEYDFILFLEVAYEKENI